MEDEEKSRRQKARQDGIEGERVASAYLQDKGLQLLEANYRYSHREIDLIMQQEGTIVFVEVKTRACESPVSALLAVDRRKQRLLFSAAAKFLRQRPDLPDARFDIVWVESSPAGDMQVVEHIVDAFSPFGG